MSSVAIWDAGILISGNLTSLVFPLDDPSIEAAEDIVAITSSCECTTAEACDYWDTDGRRRVAIHVRAVETIHSPRMRSASNLAIILTITTHKGGAVHRTVRVFLSPSVSATFRDTSPRLPISTA